MNVHLISSNKSDDEIRQVARLHKKYINLGFLSQLGVKFLFYLYQSINAVPSTILIVAKDGEKVVGFACGAVSLKPVYANLIKYHFFQVGLVLLPQVFSLSTLRKIKETLSYSSKGEEVDQEYPDAELLSIAVDPDVRGKGIASKLLDALGDEFKARKIFKYKIIVGSELTPAQRFYEKSGAIKVGEIEVHEGEASFVYLVDLLETNIRDSNVVSVGGY